jgi:hypothetical protein
MTSFRLRKFAPVPPLIYTSTAGQLALLENGAPQALIKFYFRLAAWQRDVENIASDCDFNNKGAVPPQLVQFLAQRLHQTLAPGLKALGALSPLVEQHERIEAAAIAGYDAPQARTTSKGGLRDRIAALTETPPNSGFQGDEPNAVRA